MEPQQTPFDRIPAWLRPFQRVTSGRSILTGIDGLRFIAILGVVLFHFSNDIYSFHASLGVPTDFAHSVLYFISKGGAGVALFFCISGFILYLPFLDLDRPVSLQSFYWRRVTRIEPPFIINIIICFAIAVHHLRVPIADMLPDLVKTLSYSNFLLDHKASNLNSVTWSLELEVQFYILLPLFASFIVRRIEMVRYFIYATVIGIGVLLKIYGYESSAWTKYTLLGGIGYFFTGVIAADLWKNHWSKMSDGLYPDLFFLCGLAIWMIFATGEKISNLTYCWAFVGPIGFLGMICGALRGTVAKRILGFPFIWITGGMCYTIYLYHSFFGIGYHFVKRIGSGLPFAAYFCVQSAILLPLVWGASTVLFLLFEKPFMKKDWPKRVLSRFA